MKPGTSVMFFSAGGNAAYGFGLSGSFGVYRFTAANGSIYTGSYGAAGLGVGLGASAGARVGYSPSLDTFFGASGTASVSLMAATVSISINESGIGVSGGIGLGLGIVGDSTRAFPIGTPRLYGC
jgi:hypothetical protein